MIRTKSGIPLHLMLKRRFEQGLNAAENEAYSSGHRLVLDAMENVPVDTGALQSSGSVTGPTRTKEISSLEVYFGDTNILNPDHGRATSTYAMDQHENTTYDHVNGGGPFYLTNSLKKLRSGIVKRIHRAYLKGIRF